MHVIVYIYACEFWDEHGELAATIKVENLEISRSRMTKRNSSLDSSNEI